MGKRKRASEESLEERLEQFKTDLFRALKKVKGFERQRLSRKVREKGIPPEKKEKIDLEIGVLKSLDLHHTAYHYLYTSLLKIKSIASHPDLPDVVRRELPKPELDEKEQAALHHVTSCLFNRLEVRQVMDKVVNEVCGLLKLPPPEKKKGKKKGGKDDREGEADVGDRRKRAVDGEDEKAAKKQRTEKKEKPKDEDKKPKKAGRKEEADIEDDQEDEEDEEEKAPGDEVDTDEEERAFAKYASLLAGSSEESDADSESESDHIQKGKRRSIRVRDMSISLSPEPEFESGSAPAPASPSVSASEAESQAEQSESESESEPDEPPSKQPKLSKARRARSPDQTFLPTLMGGYVSGSESSASEVDVAPRKNRLGQKQRQAIWEKKFGEQAKHMQQQQKRRGKGKGAVRGDGWDLRRGAVDEDGGGRKPWKKGIEGPLSAAGRGQASGGGAEIKPHKDNEGVLHPSWEARKKAKEKEQQQPRRIDLRPTRGNNIVFDD